MRAPLPAAEPGSPSGPAAALTAGEPGAASEVAEVVAGTELLLELGQALHRYGYPSPQLEKTLSDVAARLGVDGQFFSTPTSLFVGLGTGAGQRTYMLRVEPGGVELERLAAVEEISGRFCLGETAPPAALAALRRVAAAPPRYGTLAGVVGFGIAAGAAARFVGGGWREIALAGLLGLVTGVLAWCASRSARLGRFFEPLAATVVAGAATAAHGLGFPVSSYVVTLAALIVLLPGFSLTVALTELATRHLASGTARLAGAAVVFLTIGFGVGLGERLATLAVGAAAPVEPLALPGWTLLVAVLVAAVGFAVTLRAHPAHIGWMTLGGLAAFGGSRLGLDLLGPQLGPMLAAFAVGVVGNVLARLVRLPATVVQVPGILMLVPGSMGFRSFSSLLERQTVLGVETAFQMAVVAVALVTGMLLASVVVPTGSRRRA